MIAFACLDRDDRIIFQSRIAAPPSVQLEIPFPVRYAKPESPLE